MSAPVAAEALATFASGLRYEDIPAAVVDRAKTSIIDTVAVQTFGASLPWSRMLIEYVKRNSAPGNACIMGTTLKVRAPGAALANGALAHAFEMDGLVLPSLGVHPGASMTSPGLAVAQGKRASGKALIAAWVAGCEVMSRIADAARHSSEKLGFHAPGLTGVFGGAIVAGKLNDLDPARMANALGIGGSLCSGLLEFTQSGGGMVKRLHLGRAAEGGVLAAVLARDGFTGPHTVVEGRYGFLNVFCRDTDLPRAFRTTQDEWYTLRLMMKRYACHITAHVPVTAVMAVMAQHGIGPADVASVMVAGNEKMLSHHDIPEPQDLMMAQYSTPFCVALAFHRDALDPSNFSEASLGDPGIRALARNVKLVLRESQPGDHAFVTRLTVNCRDGREITHEQRDYPGMPSRPLTGEERAAKFEKLTGGRLARVLARLDRLEQVADCATLFD